MSCFRRFAYAALFLAGLPVIAAEPLRVANEGDIKTSWTLVPGTRLAAPVYPPQFSDRALEACVAVGYLLNADGSTSHYALLKA